MTYLVRLLEDFISYINYEKQPILKKQFLLTELRERNLDRHFRKTAEDLKPKIKNFKFRDQSYHYQHYLYETELDFFFIKNEDRKNNDSIQRKTDNLDLFYFIGKLKNCCEMLNRKNIVASDYHTPLLNELLDYLKNILNIVWLRLR